MSRAGAGVPLLRIAERRLPDDLMPRFTARLGDPPIIDPHSLADTPVLVAPAYPVLLERLAVLLDKALRAVVARYFDDQRIRAIYALPEPMEAILRLAHGWPYRVGWYRPDLVHDADGRPRVCEIGARYPLNGWLMSERAAEVLAPWAAATGEGAPTGCGFVDTLCAGYRPGETVAALRTSDAGAEIFLLAEMLRERGVDFTVVSPAAIALADGGLRADWRPVDHVIVEMDRSELPLIPAEVLRHLVETGRYLNDVRTLILVHDKRVLAVLWDDAIRRDLLPADEAEELRGFLIPSWTVTDAGGCDALIARDEDMIAKRSSGGRGIDALVRHECGEAAWRARVERDWAKDVYQRYLPQRDFGTAGDACATHLVAMHLCRDATSYGAGVFRGSAKSVINLHGERGLIHLPLVVA